MLATVFKTAFLMIKDFVSSEAPGRTQEFKGFESKVMKSHEPISAAIPIKPSQRPSYPTLIAYYHNWLGLPNTTGLHDLPMQVQECNDFN